MEQKHLTASVYTFENLIEGGYLYVDKTAYLWELLRCPQGIYFLSRPRRFGKSLTLSTLKAIFQGKRHLFKGLALESTPHKWEEHPVIHLDMGKCASKTVADLESALVENLDAIGLEQGVTLSRSSPSGKFAELIEALARRSKAVILIDEYDKPILDNIDDKPLANGVRRALSDFYSIIKATEAQQRFVLLTGVSKFTQVSVFSALNNLADLTMDATCATMLGYTQEELESNFSDRIDAVAAEQRVGRRELLDKLRRWYNGYCFHPKRPTVYNPVSIAKFFASGGEFENYWFATATPSFLLKLVKQQQFDFEAKLAEPVESIAFSAYDIEHLQALPLLFQTGYLTIKRTEQLFDLTYYYLGFPNQEVEAAFEAYLLEDYCGIGKDSSGVHAAKLAKLLMDGKLDQAMELLKGFFAGIPYDLHAPSEKYYQTIFFIVFRMLGIFVEAEVRTNAGRIDAAVQAGGRVYLFEFKLDGSADKALEQIKEREYFQKYQPSGKPLILVGANFSAEQRNLGEWKTETLEPYGDATE